MGKSKNDINEGKCTWITCKILEKLSQKSDASLKLEEFRKNFCKRDEKYNRIISEVIQNEKVDSDFQTFQDEFAKEIRSEISLFPLSPICEVLYQSVNDIINRQK